MAESREIGWFFRSCFGSVSTTFHGTRTRSFIVMVTLLSTLGQVFSANSMTEQGDNYSRTDEERLLHHLLDGRPRLPEILPRYQWNSNAPMNLSLDTILFGLHNVESSKEEVEVNLWMSLKWKAEILQWNRSTFGIDYLFVEAGKVWTPTFVCPQSIGNQLLTIPHNTSVLVQYDGTCTLDHVSTFRIKCGMKACLFPADDHICPIALILYKYNISRVVLWPKENKALRQSLQDKGSSTWKAAFSLGERGTFRLPTLNDFVFSTISYNIILARKSRFFTIIVLLPVSLIFLTGVFSILLPASTGERTGLLVTCLLGLIVYLDVAFRYLPESSAYTPGIAAWLLIVMAFFASQILCACLTSRFSSYGSQGKRLSRLERVLILHILGPVMCFNLSNCGQPIRRWACCRKRQSHVVAACSGETKATGAGIPEEDTKSFTMQNNIVNEDTGKESELSETRMAIQIVDSFSLVITFSLSIFSLVFFLSIFKHYKYLEDMCSLF